MNFQLDDILSVIDRASEKNLALFEYQDADTSIKISSEAGAAAFAKGAAALDVADALAAAAPAQNAPAPGVTFCAGAHAAATGTIDKSGKISQHSLPLAAATDAAGPASQHAGGENAGFPATSAPLAGPAAKHAGGEIAGFPAASAPLAGPAAKHAGGEIAGFSAASAPLAGPAALDAAAQPPADPAYTYVDSPMVGTFYAAPKEGAPAYVKPGDHVDAGSVVGIVEAMKLMNEIEAECAGTVVEVMVKNGDILEYGQHVIKLRGEA